MRAVLLITFIVCLYFHFQKKNVDMEARTDSLSTKQSSIKKIVPAKSQLPVLADSSLNESTSMAIGSDENDELVAGILKRKTNRSIDIDLPKRGAAERNYAVVDVITVNRILWASQ